MTGKVREAGERDLGLGRGACKCEKGVDFGFQSQDGGSHRSESSHSRSGAGLASRPLGGFHHRDPATPGRQPDCSGEAAHPGADHDGAGLA